MNLQYYIISLFILILIIYTYTYTYKNKVSELFSNNVEYIPYWEIKKIRDYEECAWRNIPQNKETIYVSYDDNIIKNVINKVLEHYQNKDYIEQFQYRIFNNSNDNKIKLTKYKDTKYYSTILNIYRIYVNNHNNIYNQNMELDLDQLINSQGFELNVLFKVVNNNPQIIKVEYIRPIQNEKYIYINN
jgi:hypothetical protein